MTRPATSIAAASLLAALALLVQLAPGAAHAAGRVALVIGNAAYEEAPLRNPVNDARAMAGQLGELGFEVIRLENATKEQMERAVVDLVGRLEKDSSALFYYAGHGVQVRGRNYLVPVDARIGGESEVRIESVGVNLLLDELAYAGNRLNIVILDACRNNPFERRLRGMSRGLAAVDAARGTLIAYATAPGSVALDGDGENGLYTEALLRALRRPGLEVEEVFKQVRIEVARRTRNQQIPWESSSLTGDFVFNAQAPKATAGAGETAFWESAERLATVDAYQAYLEQFPGGVFERLATLRIAELESAQTSPAAQLPAPSAAPAPGPVAMLDQKPDEALASAGAGPATAERSGKARYTIAMPPPEGVSWNCEEPYDLSSLTAVIRRHMYENGLTPARYAYDAAPSDVRLNELWRPSGVRKQADAEVAYRHGRRLEVDGVLTVWYEVSGTYCSRFDIDVRLFDAALERTYRQEATNLEVEKVAEVLVSRFLEGRASAGRAP